MPKSGFQKVVFGTLMALAMVYGMEVYNAGLRTGGLSKACFQIPFGELLLLGVVVFLLQAAVGAPIARWLTSRTVGRRQDKPFATTLVRPFFMVCCMCPMMSLVAVALFKGLDGEVLVKWSRTLACNFPMALGWQMLIAGPGIRLLCRYLFAPSIRQGLSS